ncbi:hypothetical protein PHYNN_228 [Pantoea phage Phynn]|nr:hypothetical protein PHYNN_228 [Pantoea phage Phynn]
MYKKPLPTGEGFVILHTSKRNRQKERQIMATFKLAELKKKSAESLSNIRAYGHPSYTYFSSVQSVCKRFEMYVEIEPGRRNLNTGKTEYRLNAQIFKLPEGVDPDAEDATEGAELVADVEGRNCRNKSEIWAELASLIEDVE